MSYALRTGSSVEITRSQAGSWASGEAKDIHGRDVLTAYAQVVPLGWLVFAEIPVEDADSLAR